MNQRAEVKRRKKSFWAMLLAVLLIINMIPASVYAADIEMGIAKDESSVSDYKGKIVTAGNTMTWTFQSTVDGYSMDQDVSIIYEYKNVEKSEMITGTPDADNKTGYSTGDKFHYSYAVKNLANAGFTVDATDPSSAISGYKIKSINENTGYSGGYYFYELQLQAVYSVEFVTAHGTAPATQYAAYGETVADPGALSSDHYDFDGWYTDNSFDENSKWDFKNNTVTQNTVLYAKWIPKKYTITWIDEDDTVLETDQNVDAGTIPTYDGTEPTKQSGSQYEYTFAGWNPTPVEVAGDATYKATYTETERKYDVTFNKNGHGKEDAPSSQSVAYNGTVTKPADLTDDCYDFGGWYKESSCQNAWDFDKDTVTIKTVIYAKWTPKTFGISYELYGGTNSASNPANYTYGIGVKSLENATKTGHDFNGWFISRDFEKPVLSPVIPDNLYGNVVFYAKFTPKEYKINYVLNGGTNPEINPLKYKYGQGVKSLVDPSKTGHTFKGWYTDPEFKTPIGSVVVSDTDMGDKTFYARWDINKYTITWKNIGGAILETDVNVEYGTTPTYDGTTPTTEGTAEYSYSFDGWNPSVKKVDDDAEYTAKYKSTKNKYTVTWKNDNGTVLETDKEVEYGTMPTYDGTTPTKGTDKQYSYTFDGWNPEVKTVTDDATYEAKFKSTVNKYTVTWKNDDGTTLETDNEVPYGTIPTYDSATPTKKATAQYTYSFSGWSPAVEAITGNTVYTAQYTPTVNKYTVTWKNDNGTVLETDKEVEYGTTPTYDGTTPTKKATAQYTYSFSGWSPTVEAITGNTVYTAQYTPTVNKYTVTWKNDGGKVLETDTDVPYGTTPTYDGATPTKKATAQYTYSFSGWSPTVEAITGNTVYTAQYTPTVNKYTVTWKNYDGTVLETETDVPYGTTPTYDGATPTKKATAQYTYSFSGWSPTVEAITGNTVYTAQYSDTVNKYTVTWKNYDGTVLETDKEIEYGTTPTYDSATPTKQATAQYTYSFSGWSPTVEAITGNTVYTAQYTPTVNKYTVTWKNDNGTVLETDKEVEYGTTPTYDGATPTKKATAQYTYSFSGWSPTVDAITGNTVYTAQYTPTVNKYTVTWKNDNGTVLETDENVTYGTTPTYDGATPTKKATAQYTYSFSGWSPTVEAITGNTVYTAQYSDTVNKYTVTWKNIGQTIETDTNVEYGEMPTYDGATPTKKADKQYSYTFDGWNPEVETVTGDASYEAKYKPAVNKYKVTFVDEDGTTVLKAVASYEYGTKAEDILRPKEPTKTATAEWTYTFDGWTPAITDVTDNATYKATYTATRNKYNVTFVDEDGTTVLKDAAEYEYGTKAAEIVKPENPKKKATAEYTYTFAGWSPEITDVTGTATYKATYTATKNKYKVTFVDEDGTTVLKDAEEYEYGTKAADIEKPVDPIKEANAEYTYTFAGWSPELKDVTGNVTYKAVYSAKKNQYKITFVDEDGTTILKDATPYDYGTSAEDIVKPVAEKASTEEYVYEFAGWNPEVTEVTGDKTYTAVYTEKDRLYKVTFVDDDGTSVIKVKDSEGNEVDSISYKYGTKSSEVATPDTPEKASTAEFSYSFAGWEPAVTDVIEDAVYKAVYINTLRQYYVTFVDDDGVTVLKEKTLYDYGTEASEIVKPEDPVKAEDEDYIYSFAGWEPSIEEVTGDVIYKAVYNKTSKKPVTYNIRYDLNGGTLDGKTGVISIQAEEGTVITIPDAPTKDGYKFLYWKGSEYHPGDKYTVVGDHTFTAEWQMIVKDEPKKEEPKKDKDTPGTGDAADPLLWMAISMCALSGIIFIRKKKRQ